MSFSYNCYMHVLLTSMHAYARTIIVVYIPTSVHTYIHSYRLRWMHIHIHVFIRLYAHTYTRTHPHINAVHTLHCITLHCLTLHYITLHNITLDYIHTYLYTLHTLHTYMLYCTILWLITLHYTMLPTCIQLMSPSIQPSLAIIAHIKQQHKSHNMISKYPSAQRTQPCHWLDGWFVNVLVDWLTGWQSSLCVGLVIGCVAHISGPRCGISHQMYKCKIKVWLPAALIVAQVGTDNVANTIKLASIRYVSTCCWSVNTQPHNLKSCQPCSWQMCMPTTCQPYKYIWTLYVKYLNHCWTPGMLHQTHTCNTTSQHVCVWCQCTAHIHNQCVCWAHCVGNCDAHTVGTMCLKQHITHT